MAGRYAGRHAASARSGPEPDPAELPVGAAAPRAHRPASRPARLAGDAAPARTTVAAATNSCRWNGARCSTCWRRSSRGCATRTGIGAIFGGSYGWSSAGRFHHAQSQIHRFLNTALGGYVRSVNSYSAGASNVMLPHILGGYDDVTRRNVSWDDIVQYTDIVVAFGGMATKNSRVASGGISEHTERKAMEQARERGTDVRPGQPAALGPAGRGRGRVARARARHRRRADARHRPHAGRRKPARPRLPRQPLHRLGRVRGLPDGPQRRRAEDGRLGGVDLRHRGLRDRRRWRGGLPASAC